MYRKERKGEGMEEGDSSRKKAFPEPFSKDPIQNSDRPQPKYIIHFNINKTRSLELLGRN